jgi:hypothetical protein
MKIMFQETTSVIKEEIKQYNLLLSTMPLTLVKFVSQYNNRAKVKVNKL